MVYILPYPVEFHSLRIGKSWSLIRNMASWTCPVVVLWFCQDVTLDEISEYKYTAVRRSGDGPNAGICSASSLLYMCLETPTIR